MKNKGLAITAVLLALSIGNYFRIIDEGNVRLVEFVSILVIGILTGILQTSLIKKTRS
jgi:hypothetical protein